LFGTTIRSLTPDDWLCRGIERAMSYGKSLPASNGKTA